MNRYWDQYYPGGPYDALSRRRNADTSSAALASPGRLSASKSTSNASIKKNPSSPGPVSRVGLPKSATRTVAQNRAAPAAGASNAASSAAVAAAAANWEREKNELETEYQRMLHEVTLQTQDLKVTVEQVEKEREFYFSKLREIETFVQSTLDGPLDLSLEESLKQIQVNYFLYAHGDSLNR